MRNWLLGAVMAGLAVVSAQNATAAVFRYTIVGTVDAGGYGDSAENIFSYSESPFKADFYVNDALPGALYTQDEQSSGVRTAPGGKSPVLGYLTIEGIAFNFSNDASILLKYYNVDGLGPGKRDRLVLGVGGISVGNMIDDSDLTFDLVAPNGTFFSSPDFRELGTFDLGPVVSDSNGLIIRGTQQPDGSITDAIEDTFIFTPTTLTVSAVPEPATWLITIGGFGFTGAAMRRRRGVRAIVALV